MKNSNMKIYKKWNSNKNAWKYIKTKINQKTNLQNNRTTCLHQTQSTNGTTLN